MSSKSVAVALATLRRVCEQAGLDIAHYRILSERFNLIVHLCPHPVVARVGTGAGSLRHASDWMRRECEVTEFLARCGAPAGKPSCGLSGRLEDGLPISFWEYIEASDMPFDAFAAGSALRGCHLALACFDFDQPVDLALAETGQLFDEAIVERHLAASTLHRLGEAMAMAANALVAAAPRRQSIHGDADWHNVLAGRDGPVWIDWEDTHFGPVEWDLASAVTSLLLAEDAAGAASFCRGYGADYDAHLMEALIGACLAREILWAQRCDRSLESEHASATARLAEWLHGNAPALEGPAERLSTVLTARGSGRAARHPL